MNIMKWMRKLMGVPNCKETARLISEGLDRDLPWLQRKLLHIHLSVCKGCGRYAEQINTLQNVFSRYDKDMLSTSSEAPILSAEAEARLKQSILKANQER